MIPTNAGLRDGISMESAIFIPTTPEPRIFSVRIQRTRVQRLATGLPSTRPRALIDIGVASIDKKS